MRKIIILGLLLISSNAIGQSNSFTGTINNSDIIVSVPSCIEQFKDLPKLAERLNVSANTLKSNTFVLGMCDGRKYDFIALINAFLDRMDKILPKE